MVELPATMVGEHNPFDPCLTSESRIVRIGNALDKELPGPRLAQLHNRVPRQVLVEAARQVACLRHRAASEFRAALHQFDFRKS